MIELDYFGLDQQQTTNLEVIQKAIQVGKKFETLPNDVDVDAGLADLFTFTVKEKGTYDISASITFNNARSSAASVRWIHIYLFKNDVKIAISSSQLTHSLSGGETTNITLFWNGVLEVDDKIKLSSYAQLSGIIRALGYQEIYNENFSQWLITKYPEGIPYEL